MAPGAVDVFATLPLATYQPGEIILAEGSKTGRLWILKNGAVSGGHPVNPQQVCFDPKHLRSAGEAASSDAVFDLALRLTLSRHCLQRCRRVKKAPPKRAGQDVGGKQDEILRGD